MQSMPNTRFMSFCWRCAARSRLCKWQRHAHGKQLHQNQFFRPLPPPSPSRQFSGSPSSWGLIPRLSADSAVLGIESSCDDTGVGVVDVGGRVRGEALHSQLSVHQATGGVVPAVAGQLHEEHLCRTTQLALERGGVRVEDVAAVAVTTGPGLAPCLKAGLLFAKDLARRANKPLVSVHHMEAHALTPRLQHHLPFPYLVLLVSGGHCLLAVAHGPGSFSRLGSTVDDSPGEAFDKVARWLALPSHPEVSHLSGGAAIEKLAKRGNPDQFPLPDVLLRRSSCNFSFSGLKTATRELIRKVAIETDWDGSSPLVEADDIAACFQAAVCRHLVSRTHRAMLFCRHWAPGITQLVVSGGVASNSYLRSRLEDVVSQCGYSLHCPPLHLCTDNGVMIAWAAIEHLKVGQGVVADVEALDFKPKWPLGTDVSAEVERARIRVPATPSLAPRPRPTTSKQQTQTNSVATC